MLACRLARGDLRSQPDFKPFAVAGIEQHLGWLAGSLFYGATRPAEQVP